MRDCLLTSKPNPSNSISTVFTPSNLIPIFARTARTSIPPESPIMKQRTRSLLGATALFAILALTACQTAPSGKAEADKLASDAEFTQKRALEQDPDLKQWFNKSHAYVIFPSIGKGGIGIGGSFGRGIVYLKGTKVGYASITEGSIGFQLGAQSFSELVFLQNKKAYEKFTSGSFELGAQASAVAVTEGASAKGQFTEGVAVFTFVNGGLMYEATVGGQKFNFTPMAE